MKALLLGANGWLAQFFYQEFIEYLSFATPLELIGTYHQTIPTWIPSERTFQLDLESKESIEYVLTIVQPDIIFHFAAISSPVKCHQDESLASLVNSPLHLLHTIQKINPAVLYLFTSTDMVYDGEHPPYHPTLQPNPRNIYGKTKLQYEESLLEGLPNAVILRLSNMLGPGYQYQSCGEKFLEWLKNCYEKRQFIGLKQDEIRCFVNVKDVCQLIMKIIHRYHDAATTEDFRSVQEWIPLAALEGYSNTTRYRVYNVGGPVGLSRLDIARHLCEVRSTELVIKESSIEPDKCIINELEVKKAQWQVYIMPNASSASTTPQQLVSPRDITMDSTLTEHIWQIRFKHVSEYIHLY